MANPFETATQEHNNLVKDYKIVQQDLQAAIGRENILKGQIATLDLQLIAAKDKADYWMRCTVEIARQMHNVGMMVEDAMNTARKAVAADDAKGTDIAVEGMQKALIGDGKAKS